MRKRNGFTLIEMLVATAVLGILSTGAVLSIQRANSMLDAYMEAVAVDQLLTISHGADAFRKLYGRQPESIGEIAAAGILSGSDQGEDETVYDWQKIEGCWKPVIVWKNGKIDTMETIIARNGFLVNKIKR